MKVLKWLDKHFEEIITSALLVAMTLAMTAQIIWRYVFNNSLQWPEEFCRFTFIWMCFFGLSWCIRNGDMLRIDVFETLFPVLKKPFAYIAVISSIAFCAFMIKPGIDCYAATVKSLQVSAALQIPMQFIYLSFLLATIMGVIRGVEKLVLMIIGKDHKTYEKEDM